MFARVSESSVPPAQDEALRAAEEHIGPALSKQRPERLGSGLPPLLLNCSG